MKQKMFSDSAFSFENLVAVHNNDSWKQYFYSFVWYVSKLCDKKGYRLARWVIEKKWKKIQFELKS